MMRTVVVTKKVVDDIFVKEVYGPYYDSPKVIADKLKMMGCTPIDARETQFEKGGSRFYISTIEQKFPLDI